MPFRITEAIEEALAEMFDEDSAVSRPDSLRHLWQRAQEAGRAERGSCIHPGCDDTAAKRWPVCYKHRNEPHWSAEAEREENCKAVCERCADHLPRFEAKPFERDGKWWHRSLWTLDVHPAYCWATAIRNRAARASKEPKA